MPETSLIWEPWSPPPVSSKDVCDWESDYDRRDR